MRQLLYKLKNPIKYTCVALLILFISALLYSDKNSTDKIEYSTQNPKKDGIKAMYMLAEDMGYSVSRYQRPSRFLPDNGVLVAIMPQTGRIDKTETKYLKEWVEKGNVFVIGDTVEVLKKILPDLPYKEASEVGRDHYIPLGSGKVILLDSPRNYANENILKMDSGVNFINILDNTGKKRVFFNEYYHGQGEENISIWDLIGNTGELIIIQIVLFFMVFVWYWSRRFGKPVTVFEIVKRKENESMFAMANIYLKAKAYNTALKIYLRYFNKILYKYLGINKYSDKQEIEMAINSNTYLRQHEAGKILNTCNNCIANEINDFKLINSLISKLEVIRKGIR